MERSVADKTCRTEIERRDSPHANDEDDERTEAFGDGEHSQHSDPQERQAYSPAVLRSEFAMR